MSLVYLLDYLVGISDVKYYMTQDTVLQENIAKKKCTKKVWN